MKKSQAGKAQWYYQGFYLLIFFLVGMQQSWAAQHFHLADQHTHHGLEHHHPTVAHTPHLASFTEHSIHHWVRIVDVDSKYQPSKHSKIKNPNLGILQDKKPELVWFKPSERRFNLTSNFSFQLTPYLIPPPVHPL